MQGFLLAIIGKAFQDDGSRFDEYWITMEIAVHHDSSSSEQISRIRPYDSPHLYVCWVRSILKRTSYLNLASIPEAIYRSSTSTISALSEYTQSSSLCDDGSGSSCSTDSVKYPKLAGLQWDTVSLSPKPKRPFEKTYRVQGIPDFMNKAGLQKILQEQYKCGNECDQGSVRIDSLAEAPDGQTLIATISFLEEPSRLLRKSQGPNHCSFERLWTYRSWSIHLDRRRGFFGLDYLILPRWWAT